MLPGRSCVRHRQVDDQIHGRGSSSEQRCCGHSDTEPRHHPRPRGPAGHPCLCEVYRHRETNIHRDMHTYKHRHTVRQTDIHSQTSPSLSRTSWTPLPMWSLQTQTHRHTDIHRDRHPDIQCEWKKSRPPLKHSVTFSLVINLCNWKLPWLLPTHIPTFTPILIHLSEYLYKLYRFYL